MGESRGRAFRKTYRWQKLCRQMRATHPPVCCICNRYIDLTLPHNHRHAFTVDHIHEIEDGGDPFDPTNLQVVCRSCNSSKGNRNQRRRRQDRIRQQAAAREFNPSRSW